MVEIERNPLAVRQGAAAVACIAAAAVAMPVIAHRAAQQREGGDVQLASLETRIGGDLFSRGSDGVQLTLVRNGDGFRGRGVASSDPRALLVQAALRGPFAADAAETPTPKALNPRELRCLSEAIYYEARGESQRGQMAVAEVVMNRTRSGYYPTTVCGVVYQGSARSTGCQFTFTCDGSLAHRAKGVAWTRAQRVARVVMLGYARPVTARATHYHTVAVDPYWSSAMVETGRVGQHVFYRFPNRAERALLVQARGYTRHAPREDSVDPAVIDPAVIDPSVAEALAAQQQPVVDLSAPDVKAAAPAPQPEALDILGPLMTPTATAPEAEAAVETQASVPAPYAATTDAALEIVT